MRLWLVSYDIADDRRRRRTANVLHTQLERVQESVFGGWLMASQALTHPAAACKPNWMCTKTS